MNRAISLTAVPNDRLVLSNCCKSKLSARFSDQLPGQISGSFSGKFSTSKFFEGRSSLPQFPAVLSGLLCFVAIGVGSLPQSVRAQVAVDLFPTAQSSQQSSQPTQPGQQSLVLLVSPTIGNDATANGSQMAPFRTITRALEVAPPNTLIVLTPGIYSPETGERFPLRMKPGVVIQGDPQTRGDGIVIRGSGSFLSPTFARQNVTLLGGNQSALVGVTVTNPEPQGYGLWVESTSPIVTDNTFTASGHDGISVVGNSSPLIRSNYFFKNGANGITIYGTSRPEVRENIFEQTGFAININQKAAPIILGNRITQNKDGVVVQMKATPILRNNSVEGNERDGLVAIADSQPNLGTATEPGGNLFRNNGQFDVNGKASSQVIPAFGNEMSKTTGQLDLTGTAVAASPIAPTPSAPAIARVPSTIPSPISATSPPPSTPFVPTPTVAVPNIKSATSTVPTAADTLAAIATTPSSEVSADSFPIPTALQATRTSELPPRELPSAAVRSTPMARTLRPAIAPVATPVPNPSQLSSALEPAPASSEPAIAPTQPSPLQTVSLTAPRVPAPLTALPSNAPLVSSRRSLPVLPKASALVPSNPPAPTQPSTTQPTSPLTPMASAVLPFRVPTSSQPIAIPVPQPETGPVALVNLAAAPVPTNPSPNLSPNSGLPPSPATLGLLPVPGPNVPIGNVGDGAGVSVYRAGRAAQATASMVGLRYRVVVLADSDRQDLVRALVPNAFRTSINGRTVIQVGAFGDRDKADELVRSLMSQGLSASVESIK